MLVAHRTKPPHYAPLLPLPLPPPTIALPEPTAPLGVSPIGRKRVCCRVVVWLPSTNAIAIAGDDCVVEIFASECTQECYAKMVTSHDRIYGVCEAAPNVIITVGHDKTICAWKIIPSGAKSAEGIRISTAVTPDEAPCTALARYSASTYLVGTVSGSLVLIQWNGKSLHIAGEKSSSHRRRVDDIHVRGDLIATSSKDKSISFWDRKSFTHYKDYGFQSRVFSIRISDHSIAAGYTDFVDLFQNNPPNFSRYSSVQLNCGVVWSLRFILPDIVLASGGSIISLIRTGCDERILERFQLPAKILQDVEILPNGNVAVAGTGISANSRFEFCSHLTENVKKFVSQAMQVQVEDQIGGEIIPDGDENTPVNIQITLSTIPSIVCTGRREEAVPNPHDLFIPVIDVLRFEEYPKVDDLERFPEILKYDVNVFDMDYIDGTANEYRFRLLKQEIDSWLVQLATNSGSSTYEEQHLGALAPQSEIAEAMEILGKLADTNFNVLLS